MAKKSSRFFNTAGPILPSDHYFLPQRLNEEELYDLVEKKGYFILHAPRQTGKTTAILNFAEKLKKEGKYFPLYVNVEPAQAARGNVREGIFAILSQIKSSIYLQYGPEEPALGLFDRISSEVGEQFTALSQFLQLFSSTYEKPLVLFIDEIDSLIGDTLISVLRQLRTGYPNRPRAFPQSICLIGVRDVRDYRLFSEEKQAMILGGSTFNIKTESLLLPNFTREEVKALYHQHTEETGQPFSDEAMSYAFEQTQGQPWLVNALAYQSCFRDVTDRSIKITKEALERATDQLILRRDTHLDVLLDRLKEERVCKQS